VRILFVAHHRLAAGTGVGNATYSLAAAMRADGHTVNIWSHEEAFGSVDPPLARIRFPWRVARHLRRVASQYDVVDAMTGDACHYLRSRSRGPVVVSRAHGLEHVADASRREHARREGRGMRLRYRAYTGGYRLWEVRRSLELADGAAALNEGDARFMRERMRVEPSRVLCIPNGLDPRFLGLPAPDASSSATRPLRVVFIGSWIELKGLPVIITTLNGLAARQIEFRAELLGTGDIPASEILAPLSDAARARTEVIPRYDPVKLPEMLAGAHVLLHPSWTEGFCMALAEAMACGLAPVVTPAGAAYDLVLEGVSGTRVPADPSDCAAEVAALDGDRARLHSLRLGAQRAVQHLSWPRIARETIAFYRRLGAPA
jgi:glycosyltransferase involved in cell wall biosynthesis